MRTDGAGRACCSGLPPFVHKLLSAMWSAQAGWNLMHSWRRSPVNAAVYNLFSPFYFDCRYLSAVMSGFHRFIITYRRWPFGQYTSFTFFLQAVAFPLDIQRG